MTTITAYVPTSQSAAPRDPARQGPALDGTTLALGLGALASIGFAAVATVVMAVLL